MIKLYVLAFFCLATPRIFAQILFTYGASAVDKKTFLRAYNKNKMPVTDREQSLREYLDLYTKFKLKVKAAHDQQLDTLQQLHYDLQNFRSQVAEGYMTDAEGLNQLVEEALQRSLKDIRVLHFYIPLNDQLTPADTIKAYTLMQELHGQLSPGNTGYEQLAASATAKYPALKFRDLGYVTVFNLPYEIENLVYGLTTGIVTKPYRTTTGIHLFKHIGERKSAGRWRVAQVLLSIPPNATPAELTLIEARADTIYKQLLAGADFAMMAKQYSEDKLTFMNGGELPGFGTGKFELPFETRVFALQQDGEIAPPIATGFGYHIVKRLEHRALPYDKNEEGDMATLKQQVLKDARVSGINAAFVKTVQQKTGYTRHATVSDALLFRYADSVTLNNQVGNYPGNNKAIFSFKKSTLKVIDWLNFIKDFKLNPDVYKGEDNATLLKKYIATSTLDYYRRHLDEYSEEFKHQLDEFREGNLLFEVMERNVWGKASNDTAGLLKYYQQHKAKYTWAESAAVWLFNCSDSLSAHNAINALKSGKTWQQVVAESNGSIQADSGRYELSQLQSNGRTTLTEGSITSPVVNSGDNTTSFFKVLRLFPANQQRNFNEAKGLIINDYQSFLEEQWLDALRKKYPLKVNEAVFTSLLK